MEQLAALEQQTQKELCTESEPLYFAPGSRECPQGSRLVFGKGPADARIIFVGSNPGYKENETGEPFTGKAGKQLEKLCRMYSIDLQTIYVTNVIKLPIFNRQQPTNEDITRHSKILERQIQIIQPRLVVALGNVAAKTLLYLFPHGNLDMTTHQEADLQIKCINGHTHDLGFSYTVVTTFNPIMYTDQTYKKPLQKGFKAINHEISQERESIAKVFDVNPVDMTVGSSSHALRGKTKTREQIKTQIDTELEDDDEDSDEIFNQIQSFFQSVLEDTDVIKLETITQVATQFDLTDNTVKNIALFTMHQTPQPVASTFKRSRSPSPPSDLPSPKRSKLLPVS
jgi:uracil-DNA glycosylase family 4